MRHAFDAASSSYDAREEANPLRSRLRARSLAVLRETFAVGSRLVDIGAGTGTEAIALAREGRRVVAAEPSDGMRQILAAKAREAGVDIPTHALDARDVAKLANVGPFDGAYASFGALNCEPDLPAVAKAIASVLRPGGKLVASVLTRWAIAEMVGYTLALRPGKAFRRFRRGLPFSSEPNGPVLSIHYPSFRELRRSFAPWFSLDHAEAFALFVPPPYAAAQAARFPRALRALESADAALATRRGFRALGDHALVVLTRVAR